MAPVTAPLSPDSPFPPFFSGTRFGAMLDMLTDRCSTMCLLVNLALLYPRRHPHAVPAQHELGCGQPLAAPPESAVLGVWTGGKRYMGRDETFSGYLQATRGPFSCALLRGVW